MQKNAGFENYIDQVIKGDCMQVLPTIPDESVDLIFADPPYNLQLRGELYRPNQSKVAGVDDSWDQFSSFDSYDQFTLRWLKECQRILKKDGALWVIGSYHNIFRVGNLIQNIGFWILNDIVWIKTNPMPNFKGTRFNNAHETLIWATKTAKSKPTFHYKSMKAFNEDKQMRSDWYLPICTGVERIKENGKKAHSTQKPEALLARIIQSTSNPSDIILDPFLGSGTTAAVAKKLGRHFIGIEKEESYVKVARNRLKMVQPVSGNFLDYPSEKKSPRVPFGALIEMQYILPGDYLYSKDGRYNACVLANGTLRSDGATGSIHRVSALLLNKESNNGWTFWYHESKNGEKVLIDELRSLFIKEHII